MFTKQSCESKPDRRAPYRVLYLQSTSEIGGSDVSLLRIVEALNKSLYRPYVVLPSDGPLVEKLKFSGCEVFIVPEMRKLTASKGASYLARYLMNYPRAVAKIVGIIRRERIDAVHTNSLHNLYGFLAAKLAKRPHVWHVREIVWQSRILRRVELFLAKRFGDRIVATSDAVAEMFVSGNGGYPSQLRKISNGIDIERYRPENDGSRILEDWGIAPGLPVVGLVCRMDLWKGVDTFLRAAAICRKEFPEARYLVVGGPIEGREEYAQTLFDLAEALHLRDVVFFSGWRYRPEEMPQVHAAFSVLVLASSSPEPFGLVLLEAMATGKPVVATNHGGPREICVDGETAILVPPQQPQKMAEAILSLLRDPAKARAMGAAGRRRVALLFDQRRCIKTLESLYGELLFGES